MNCYRSYKIRIIGKLLSSICILDGISFKLWIIALLSLNLSVSCVADLPESKFEESIIAALLFGCNPPTYTMEAPRFAGINTPITISAPAGKKGSFVQTAGDSVAITSAPVNNITFQLSSVPAETLRFDFTQSGSGRSCGKVSAEVTVLENTNNPTYVNASYSGGASNGSLEKPYTDIAVAYAAAPGAVYVSGGNYPISATLYLLAGKSIYGGFTSDFKRENDRTKTVIDDTRVGSSSYFSIGTSTSDSMTYFDGITVQGPTDSNVSGALYCSTGGGIFNNLILTTRYGGTPVGDVYTVYLRSLCTATLQNSRMIPAPHTIAYCMSLFLRTDTTIVQNNELNSNDCGRNMALSLLGNNIVFDKPNIIHGRGPSSSFGWAIQAGVGTDNLTIANQTIIGPSNVNTNSARGIALQGATNVTIKNNLIYAGNGGAITGIEISNTTGLVTITGNTIIGGDQNGNASILTSTTGIYIASPQAHVIANNVIYNHTSTSENFGIALDCNPCDPIIVNNTIITGVALSGGSKAINIRNTSHPVIANNILLAQPAANSTSIVENHAGSDPSILENNLFFNMASPHSRTKRNFPELHSGSKIPKIFLVDCSTIFPQS